MRGKKFYRACRSIFPHITCFSEKISNCFRHECCCYNYQNLLELSEEVGSVPFPPILLEKTSCSPQKLLWSPGFVASLWVLPPSYIPRYAGRLAVERIELSVKREIKTWKNELWCNSVFWSIDVRLIYSPFAHYLVSFQNATLVILFSRNSYKRRVTVW